MKSLSYGEDDLEVLLQHIRNLRKENDDYDVVEVCMLDLALLENHISDLEVKEFEQYKKELEIE